MSNQIIGNNSNFAGIKNQIVVSSVEGEWFFQGKSFTYENYFTFTSGETKTFIVNPTLFSGSNIFVSPVIFYATSGPIIVNIYNGAETTENGTLLQGFNRRIGFSLPQTTIRLNPTVTSLGTKIAGDIIPATGLTPSTSTGAANVSFLPFEIDKSVKTAMTVKNEDGAGVYVEIKFTWFEV